MDLPHNLWVAATHYVAAKLVLAAPEFTHADKEKASILVVDTCDELYLAGFEPKSGFWLASKSSAEESVNGPRYGIPTADGEHVVPVPGDSYRKAIQGAYSCLLMSDPAKVIM